MPEDAKLWEGDNRLKRDTSSTLCSQEGRWEGGERLCGNTNCLFVNSTQLTQLILCLSTKTNKG